MQSPSAAVAVTVGSENEEAKRPIQTTPLMGRRIEYNRSSDFIMLSTKVLPINLSTLNTCTHSPEDAC